MTLQITETAILEGVRWDAESRRGSVLDVIRLVTGAGNPSDAFAAIRNNHPEFLDGIDEFNFPGRGRPTPVAPLKTLVEVAWLLPGKRAAEFRRVGAATMCRVLGGDLSLVDEIRARHEAIGGTEEQAAWMEGVETGAKKIEWNPRKIISDAMDKLDGAKGGLDDAGLRALVDMTSLLVRTMASAPWVELVGEPEPTPRRAVPRPLTDSEIVSTVIDSLVESGRIVANDNCYMPLDDFQRLVRDHAEGNGIARLTARDTSRRNLDPHLVRHGLSRVRDVLPYGGKRVSREYVVGIDVMAR